jgi:cell division septation protein DedD
LKKSVNGVPAFATLANTTGRNAQLASTDTQSPDKSTADKAAQDKAAADKAAADKAAQDKAAAEKTDEATAKQGDQAKPATAELTGQSASGAKEPLPNNTPVAESLSGADKVYRVWLSSKGTEEGARSEWDRLLQKYPNILKKLEPDIRQYYYNQEQGSIYRLFVGPFTSLEDAQKACGDIHERYQQEFCRTVIN